MKSKKFYLQTNLSENEVIQRMESVTDSWHKEGSKKQRFEGKVSQSTFDIKAVFDNNPYTRIKPLISGIVKKKDNGSVVDLTFRCPSVIKVLVYISSLLYLAIAVVLFLLKNSSDLSITKFYWCFLIASPVNYFGYLQLWNSGIEASLKSLRFVLK